MQERDRAAVVKPSKFAVFRHGWFPISIARGAVTGDDGADGGAGVLLVCCWCAGAAGVLLVAGADVGHNQGANVAKSGAFRPDLGDCYETCENKRLGEDLSDDDTRPHWLEKTFPKLELMPFEREETFRRFGIESCRGKT